MDMDRKKCYSIYFFDYKECPECTKYKECREQKDSDSKGSFWNSLPIENLSPEQRKHLKTIMRKEVKG